MECCTCNRVFKSKSNLNHHRKTAIYCLKLRGETGKEQCCPGCKKTFARKYELLRHMKSCQYCKASDQYKTQIQKLEKDVMKLQSNTKILEKEISSKNTIITKLESQIKELQDKLASIAEKAVSKPMIQDNRIQQINNFPPITDKHLQEHIENLTIDHIKNGASGYAQYALEYPLKDRVLCTDYSRRKLRYKNGDGQIVSDPEMVTLTKKLFSAIQERNTVLIKEYAREFQLKFLGLSSEFSDEMDEKEQEEFDQRSAEIHEFLTQITTQDRQVKELANGYRSELFHEFIRHVCSACV